MLGETRFLSEAEKKALDEIKRRVSEKFDIRRYVLFGSKARGDATPESDVDLLIISGRELSHRERHCISDILFDVNLAYDTLFSYISVDETQWNSALHGFLPIHENIEREGITV